jgi:hypothetical protein
MAKNSLLEAVSCSSARFCVAVGEHEYFRSYYHYTLVETWNGSRWTVTSSPDPGTRLDNDYLYGVSCNSAKACVAVGSFAEGLSFPQTLVESWNGSQWTVTSSPDAVRTRNDLHGVSCSSAKSCVATGFSETISIGTPSLIETFSRGTWTIIPSPNKSPVGVDPPFGAVSCPSSSFCVAAGDYLPHPQTSRDMTRTLILTGSVAASE